MGRIPVGERHRIIILHQEGFSQRQIVDRTGFSKTAIRELIKKYALTGSVEDKPKSGRPPKLKKDDKKYLRLQALRNRHKTSKDLAVDLENATGTCVTPSCVRRNLLKQGLRGCVAVRKPLFRRGNKQKRLRYAKEHKDWSQEMWNRVLYTDESKFEIFGTRRRQFVRRRKGEAYKQEVIQPTIKHGGGSVLVWGCISAFGVGDLIKIDGKLTGERYLNIIREHAVPSGRRLIGHNFMLQHDNDPKHASRIVKQYLQQLTEEGILEVMEWAPQSPDLNIIEHVWEYLERKKYERQPKNAQECFEILHNEWVNIPDDFIQNLYRSIPRRVTAVLNAKGGHTKY